MAGDPWLPAHDAELRRLHSLGLGDAAMRDALLSLRPSLTIEGIAQRRRLLGLKRPLGGNRPRPRPEGDQRACLGCSRPFRSKHRHNRLCAACRDKAGRRVA